MNMMCEFYFFILYEYVFMMLYAMQKKDGGHRPFLFDNILKSILSFTILFIYHPRLKYMASLIIIQSEP